MTVIAVIGAKGGVGKTSTTLGLAVHAQLDGLDPLVVDGDSQRSSSVWLSDHPEDEIRWAVLKSRRPRAELEALVDGEQLVVIDTPPGLEGNAVMLAAAAVADLCVLPVAPSALDATTLAATIDAVTAVCDRVAVVVVRTDSRWRLHKDLVAALEEDPDVVLLESSVPDSVVIAGAALQVPSRGLKPYATVWAEIRALLEGKQG